MRKTLSSMPQMFVALAAAIAMGGCGAHPSDTTINARDIDGLAKGQQLVIEPSDTAGYQFDSSAGPIDFKRIALHKEGQSVPMDTWLAGAKGETGFDLSNQASQPFMLGRDLDALESQLTPSPTSRPCTKCYEVCVIICIRVCVASSC